VTCLLGSGAFADFAYDFTTPPPTTFVYAGLPTSGAPSATFSSSVSDGILHLSDSRHPNSGGAFLGKALETSQVFTDVRASATLNPAGTTNNGLNVSVRESLATGNGYVAGLDFQTGRLVIGKIYGRTPVQFAFSTDPNQGSQLPLTDLARSYFLQVDAIGNKVTASLFDSPGGPQLLQVNYTDTGVGGAPFRSGVSGMSAVSDNGTTAVLLDGTFDNFTSTSVPEPGVAAAGVFLGLALCRRRHSPPAGLAWRRQAFPN
jgi:hypothetical protein